MTLVGPNDQDFTINLSLDELRIVAASLAEVTSFVPMMESEFQTRIGYAVADVQRLFDRVMPLLEANDPFFNAAEQ